MSIKGYQTVWEIMKQTADKEELKELLTIENRYKEKPTALNPLGQKLMKKKINPLDKIPEQIIKNHELYDNPNPEDLKTVKQELQKIQPKKDPTGIDRVPINQKKVATFVKNKKATEPTATQIIQDLKINMPTLVEPLTRTAEEVAAEKRFNDMMQKAEEERLRIKNSGLAYLMGGAEK
ncbi:hypothetical protein [Candidatus Pelagibacter sp. HIMB1695]|uniref:hypothetical protein n=1 Tax=Candidatus Pelagibacter sp. HIMB1695 TaxID=3413364 RepID=UPI003F87DB13